MNKPTWLDKPFVQNVLQKAENNESILVSSIIIKPATAVGDNYASEMYRITIELSRIHKGQKIAETRSVIVKVPPQGGAWSELVVDNGMFRLEMLMMVEILPTMNQMLSKFSTTSLAVRCLQVQYENPIYLMIEDLAPRGFRMAERGEGDLDHSIVAIRNIAAFHAASVAFAEKHPKTMTKCQPEYEDEDDPTSFPAYMKRSTKALGRVVANWPELNPRISQKILKLSDFLWKKHCEASLLRQDDFNVLNHGDCTMSNMMFRYDEQRKPIEQTFVDFQLCQYGSPAIDILMFLGSSPCVEVRLDERDLLIREYHNSLVKTMAKLECSTKSPSFDELQDILGQRAFCEVCPSFVTLAHALVDRTEVQDLVQFIASDEKTDNPAYRGEVYRKLMTRVLPFFDSVGLLDV